ncbi:MAG TPA: YceI family protein [Cyclobacteriaceae bacterium]
MTNRQIIYSLLFLLGTGSPLYSQRYIAEKGQISFYSDGAIEDITAVNNNVTSLFTGSTGAVAFSVPIKDFEFEKKLMREHFNDKYMESTRFPRSTFAGTVTGYSMDASGAQRVRAKGKLTIHGIVKEIDVPGSLEVRNGAVLVKTRFTVLIADYGIKIPQILWQNVSEEIQITVDLTFNQK